MAPTIGNNDPLHTVCTVADGHSSDESSNDVISEVVEEYEQETDFVVSEAWSLNSSVQEVPHAESVTSLEIPCNETITRRALSPDFEGAEDEDNDSVILLDDVESDDSSVVELEVHRQHLIPLIEIADEPTVTDVGVEDSFRINSEGTDVIVPSDDMEPRLDDSYDEWRNIERTVEALLDTTENILRTYNNSCQPAFQGVVMKSVEVEADGSYRTVSPPKPTCNTDSTFVTSDVAASDVAACDVAASAVTTSDVAASDVAASDVAASDVAASDVAASDVAASDVAAGDGRKLDLDQSEHFILPSTLPASSASSRDKQDLHEHDITEIGATTAGEVVFGNVKKFTLLPTPRILPRIFPTPGQKVYAMRNSALHRWVPAVICSINRSIFTQDPEYKLELFDVPAKGGQKGIQTRTLCAKHIAYSKKTPFILPVGSRIIARFYDELNTKPHGKFDFYAGIVAEPPTSININRYLIFFDDGYAQYTNVQHVLWVCDSSQQVWNDVHPRFQKFLKRYLQMYPERPMVKLSVGTIVSTEWNGNWWVGRIVNVDCSLLKIHFEADNRYEWIYRGSSRLGPLYVQKREETKDRKRRAELNKDSMKCDSKDMNYSNNVDPRESESILPNLPGDQLTEISCVQSTSTFRPTKLRRLEKIAMNPPQNTTHIDLVEFEGKMIKAKVIRAVQNPIAFKPHECSIDCVQAFDENNANDKLLSTLAVPLYYGWSREVTPDPQRSVIYQAPCGRVIRDYDELHQFLNKTECTMGMEYFCYSFAVDCTNQFTPSTVKLLIPDISNGSERVPVQGVNSIDNESPTEDMIYYQGRLVGDRVVINVDPMFLTCCDCKDDCSDKARCACWKLTFETAHTAKSAVDLKAGYQNRRLLEPYPTGIYECNQRCSCKKTCLNRVVQLGIKWHLQIFKTSTKGWAIRSLYDIPEGAFICYYGGEVLTDAAANEEGQAFGDEYLAELDYIEIAEAHKEGYEREVKPRGRRRCQTSSKKQTQLRPDRRSVPTRQLFGDDDNCYIMDAKIVGNVGRYFNHSCQPNVFVQNVFLDTHDIRFPWVAFFAYKNIRAGTELTWDYSYVVGSVPGRSLFCHCGTPVCRERLL